MNASGVPSLMAKKCLCECLTMGYFHPYNSSQTVKQWELYQGLKTKIHGHNGQDEEVHIS